MGRRKRTPEEVASKALLDLMSLPADDEGMWQDLTHFVGDSAVQPEAETTAAIEARLSAYSDHDVAIIFGSMLENILEAAIVRALPVPSPHLFSYQDDDGILNSFNKKIAMGAALGIYGSEMRRDMQRIKQIRNVFAHARRRFYFSDSAIVEYTKYFTLHPIRFNEIPPGRTAYACAIAWISGYLLNFADHGPSPVLNEFHDSLYPHPKNAKP